jgi:type II secretory pathway component PulJ
MKTSMNRLHGKNRLGAALTEMLIASAVTAVLAAGLLTGISTLQRSFKASQHHAKSQVEQGRLISYVSRDLRRAISVKIDQFGGAQRLVLTIPDFYDDANHPRDPRIRNDEIEYADPALAEPEFVTVAFYKQGSTIYRSVKRVSRASGAPLEEETVIALATEVDDFQPNFTDDGKQSIGVSISFIPRFRLNPDNISNLREGSAVYATTLLRNKRH